MSSHTIPAITNAAVAEGFLRARESPRRRYAHILHQPGAEFNEVFNFMLKDSYMQPHLHPSEDKCEDIFIVKGRLVLHYFDDTGVIKQSFFMEPCGLNHVRVPAFTWHTYAMLTEEVLTYESMWGKYNPLTWKKTAGWAPAECEIRSSSFLTSLRSQVGFLETALRGRV